MPKDGWQLVGWRVSVLWQGEGEASGDAGDGWYPGHTWCTATPRTFH